MCLTLKEPYMQSFNNQEIDEIPTIFGEGPIISLLKLSLQKDMSLRSNHKATKLLGLHSYQFRVLQRVSF